MHIIGFGYGLTLIRWWGSFAQPCHIASGARIACDILPSRIVGKLRHPLSLGRAHIFVLRRICIFDWAWTVDHLGCFKSMLLRGHYCSEFIHLFGARKQFRHWRFRQVLVLAVEFSRAFLAFLDSAVLFGLEVGQRCIVRHRMAVKRPLSVVWRQHRLQRFHRRGNHLMRRIGNLVFQK